MKGVMDLVRMNGLKDLMGWYWLLTGLALAAHLAGWRTGLLVAMALMVLQGVHLGLRARSPLALPVQVRAVYLGLLILGSWPPLRALLWLLLAGLAVRLVFDYCLLARLLSLLPWNRSGPLTRQRLRATLLTPPVKGSIVAALEGASIRLDPPPPRPRWKLRDPSLHPSPRRRC